MAEITIVVPVYNDWLSFECLVRELDHMAAENNLTVRVLAVDDGSLEARSQASYAVSPHVEAIIVLRLIRNLGHQRAIAVGIVEAARFDDHTAIIVMDADGEDKPESLSLLFETHRLHPTDIVVAVRGHRRETRGFRVFYEAYKLLFKYLVGKTINFGNYCLIPASLVDRLTYDPNLWNHLAASIVKAKLPVQKVRLDRGTRYAGDSKMNFEALAMHGLSAISVFIDVMFFRLMVLSTALATLAICGILVVVGILLFTELAIPGWATNAVGILSVIICQIVVFSSSVIFYVLSRRSGMMFIPAQDVERLVKAREAIALHDPAGI